MLNVLRICKEELYGMTRYVTWDTDSSDKSNMLYKSLPTPNRVIEIYQLAVEKKPIRERQAISNNNQINQNQNQINQQNKNNNNEKKSNNKYNKNGSNNIEDQVMNDWNQASTSTFSPTEPIAPTTPMPSNEKLKEMKSREEDIQVSTNFSIHFMNFLCLCFVCCSYQDIMNY